MSGCCSNDVPTVSEASLLSLTVVLMSWLFVREGVLSSTVSTLPGAAAGDRMFDRTTGAAMGLDVLSLADTAPLPQSLPLARMSLLAWRLGDLPPTGKSLHVTIRYDGSQIGPDDGNSTPGLPIVYPPLRICSASGAVITRLDPGDSCVLTSPEGWETDICAVVSRAAVPPAAGQQVWNVDPIAGNDDWDGSQNFPVKTIGEINRRCKGYLTSDTLILLLNNCTEALENYVWRAAPNALVSPVVLALSGGMPVLPSGSTVATYTPHDPSYGGNTPNVVATTPAATLPASTNLLSFSNSPGGPFCTAWASTAPAVAALPPGSFNLGPLGNPGDPPASPANVGFQQLPQIRGAFQHGPDVNVFYEVVHDVGAYRTTEDGDTYFQCYIESNVGDGSSPGFYQDCQFGADQTWPPGDTILFRSTWVQQAYCQPGPGARVFVSGAIFLDGGAAQANGGTISVQPSADADSMDVGVFLSTDAATQAEDGQFEIVGGGSTPGSPAVFGQNNAIGFNGKWRGRLILVQTPPFPTIKGAIEVAANGGAAEMNPIDAVTGMPDAAAPCSTWAALAAPPFTLTPTLIAAWNFFIDVAFFAGTG